MRRILSSGKLLLALTGAAWWLLACDGDDDPVDAGFVGDTSGNYTDGMGLVDTSPPQMPDAGDEDALD